jgi:hypothetical protein
MIDTTLVIRERRVPVAQAKKAILAYMDGKRPANPIFNLTGV